MVMALMALHGMIRDSSDANELNNWRASRYESPAEHSVRRERQVEWGARMDAEPAEDEGRMKRLREDLAVRMWIDYQVLVS